MQSISLSFSKQRHLPSKYAYEHKDNDAGHIAFFLKMYIRWEIRDFLYREIINLFSVLSLTFTETRETFNESTRVLSSHDVHARFCACSQRNKTPKCGDFGAFGNFGLINLVLQIGLFSCFHRDNIVRRKCKHCSIPGCGSKFLIRLIFNFGIWWRHMKTENKVGIINTEQNKTGKVLF